MKDGVILYRAPSKLLPKEYKEWYYDLKNNGNGKVVFPYDETDVLFQVDCRKEIIKYGFTKNGSNNKLDQNQVYNGDFFKIVRDILSARNAIIVN